MGEYDKTLGTLLVGIFFNTYLYGLVSYQFAAYYRSVLPPEFNDRPAVKYMVLFLFLLDTFHSASVVYMAWTYVVANFGNPAALAVAEWPYTFTPIGTAAAALTTQLFLGYRIWCLSESNILYGIIIIMAIPSFVLGLACSIKAWIIKVLEDLPQINNLVIAWLAMQVIVDTFVTVTLITILIRSKTGYRKTDTVLNRLIRGAIQTGLFAGIFSLGDLVSFLVLPTTNFYGMFAIPIGRIYTNTLLDTLLAREQLKTQMMGTYDRQTGLACSGSASSLGSIKKNGLNFAATQVTENMTSFPLEVHKTVQEHTDTSSFNGDHKPLAL
ncbi:hypothetical protein ID866_7451 [Astraeus odoratus]|nr:hypothetical protein ID866_7451 [Astraeus odoratus]